MKHLIKTSNSRKSLIFVLLFILIALSAACVPVLKEKEPQRSDPATKAEPTPDDPVKQEVRAFRNADFDYIFVMQRKDGEKMDKEDKQFVKNNSHPDTNRFTLSDDEKIIFAGSNFSFPDSGLEALKERFDFSDYSKPAEKIQREKEDREKEKELKEKSTILDSDTPKKANREIYKPPTPTPTESDEQNSQ